MSSSMEPKNPDFRVADEWRFLYETLCRRGKISRENDYWIFEKYTQLYGLAASIGFAIGRRRTLKSSYTPFTLNEMESDHEWPTLMAIAWKASGCDVNVLLDHRATIRVCDEFADGGMQYISEEFFSAHVKGGYLYHPKNIEIERNLALILKGIKKNQSQGFSID